MNDALAKLTVVLARPHDSGNIGAVCRAMKTMGMTRLHIAGSCPRDLSGARVLAVHALDVLDASERFDSVPDAVRGHELVVGVTRRLGRWRKQHCVTPEELADRVASQAGSRVALVFGNEESGLSDTELESCNLAVSIPSSPLFPSLNLSHAVQIVAYAVYRRLADSPSGRFAPVASTRVEEVTESLMAALREAGCFSQGFEGEMRLLYRDILARAALSESEASRVERSFSIQRALLEELRKRGAGN